jgi:hypothetical protein
MSYLSPMGGSAGFGGFGYHSLGADYPIMRRNADTLALQGELVRLRFLQPDESRFGADGIWGAQTAGSLLHAARYVGWTGAAFSPANADRLRSGTAEVSDDLLARLRAAHPAPAGTPGAVPAPATPGGGAAVDPASDRIVIGPHMDPPPSTEEANGQGWILPAAIGGAVILVGGLIAWQMKKPTPRRAVRANRRRRRRR